MKYLVLLFISLFYLKSYSQNDCSTAYQYCGNNVTLPLVTNVGDLGSIDCLGSTPNTAWFYFKVDQTSGGTVSTFLHGKDQTLSSGLDIDVIVLGPYATINCTTIMADFSTGNNPVAFCDYSTSGDIQYDLTNVQAGENYIILITNYSNQPAYVEFVDLGSTIVFDQTNCITEVQETTLSDEITMNFVNDDLLEVSNLPSENYELTIYDLTGKVVCHINDIKKTQLIKMDNFSRGMLIMSLIYGDKKSIRKFIRQ